MRVLLSGLFKVPSTHGGAIKTVTESLYSGLFEHRGRDELRVLVHPRNAGYWSSFLPAVEQICLPVALENQFLRTGAEMAGAAYWGARQSGADVYYSISGSLPFQPMPCATVVYFQNLLFYHYDEFYSAPLEKQLREPWRLKHRIRNHYNRWAYQNSMEKATEIIAVSETMKREAFLHSGVSRSRDIHVIPLGVGPRFRSPPGPRPFAKPYVMTASVMTPHKNFEDSLHVFASFKRKYDLPHVLCLLGGGPAAYLEELQQIIAEAGLEEHVHFPGYIGHDALPDWYAHADAYISTSACESFGLPLLEAMASKTPVLTSDRSGLQEIAGGAALLEDPEAHEAFADKLYAILSQRELRDELIQKGLAHSATFTWERCAKSTWEVIRAAAG